jgi:radical SAM superfamily enzyme YgiQ (UPF0313 family)
MKLLLVNTPINRLEILGNFAPIYNDMKMVPTGIAYLASYVRKNGVDVRILDQYAECLPLDRIFARIADIAPDLIGYSATTPNYFAAIGLVRAIKKEFPGIPSVMGGYHPSVLPDETLREPAVDFVIRDEGEQALLRLCETLDGGPHRLDPIDGLSFKRGTERFHNRRSSHINVNASPFPAYDLLPMHLYSSPSFTKFASPVYQMIASRGCPFQCSFCINAELNVSAKYRRREVASTVDEVEMLAERFHARQIQFWDPLFPMGQRHAREFCEEIMKRGLHRRIVWNSTTRAEFLDEDTLDLMARSGCRGIGFGVESGDPGLLRSVQKKLDLEKLRKVSRIAQKEGFVVSAFFIFGFPGETKETARTTIDYAKSLDIHYAQFSILVPYPGTPIYRTLKDSGELSPGMENDFARYNQSVGLTELDPIYVPHGWTAAELKTVQKRAYTQFYLRPKMVWRHLRHLRPSKILGMTKSLRAILSLLLRKKAASGTKA